MKTLPEKIRKNGHDYSLIKKGKKACIYRQCYEGKNIAWEVFRLSVVPERLINGKVIKEHEQFPSDSAFGTWAWTVTSWERALEKFNYLENRDRYD